MPVSVVFRGTCGFMHECFVCFLIESLLYLMRVKLNTQQGVKCFDAAGFRGESEGCEHLTVNSHFLTVGGGGVLSWCRVGDICPK